MQSASDLLGSAGGKPKLITLLTSGTGTYVPTADMARCLVRIQAGGGGGFTSGTGGGAGAMREAMIRVPAAGLAYVVGAGGSVSANGSDSTFGPLWAMKGLAATGATNPGYGGYLGAFSGSLDTDSVSLIYSGALDGVSGGAGGYTNAGQHAGSPIPVYSAYATNNGALAFYDTMLAFGNGQGTGSGGSSFYGKGGTTGNAPASDAYGAGGGANAAGRGGCIEIWDFGA